MHRRILLILLLALAGASGLRAQPIPRSDVLAAIAVLEKDPIGTGAQAAAETVTRFGRESDAVLLIVGAETLPWVQADAPPAEKAVRTRLVAVYFAGDIKSQLQQGAARDDPYRGWLAAIRAYGQFRQKQPGLVIPEIEELIRKERAGTLKAEAEAIRREQEDGQQPSSGHLI